MTSRFLISVVVVGIIAVVGVDADLRHHSHQRRSAPGTIDIKIAALFPSNRKYLFSTEHVAPAGELAKIRIAERRILAPWVNLTTLTADSDCHEGIAMDMAINLYIHHEISVYFGPVCDYAIAPIARQVKYWDLPLVSVGGMARDFVTRRRDQYPSLTRAGPFNLLAMAHAFSAIIKSYKWKKIKMIYQRKFPDGEKMPDFCNFAIDTILYGIPEDELNPDYKKDYKKMDDEDWDDILSSEVGNSHAVCACSQLRNDVILLNCVDPPPDPPPPKACSFAYLVRVKEVDEWQNISGLVCVTLRLVVAFLFAKLHEFPRASEIERRIHDHFM
ncbi:hypothetical protein CAPTEDRAFT_205131 [Capitella teleta]|uniref:Receptor ligand binding region domain-containing protein n=1 Tax=Capitella teleta TaxID=283909 RepID=R7TT54_CAPTE|nr:hypothetical protein CAPTEDRAFT_205131 [Capitella teleta]|eukprot:ELT96799.1 hypothetical protein CAPTEDRAFT_205131 [Capitella teleta]